MSNLFYKLGIYDEVYSYCLNNGECKELEQFIATSAKYSFRYAKRVIMDRFEYGEESIATKAWYAYFYAKGVIGGRFEFAEGVIASNKEINLMYQNFLESL